MPIGGKPRTREILISGGAVPSALGQPCSPLPESMVQDVPSQTPTVSFDSPLPARPPINNGPLPDDPHSVVPIFPTNYRSILVHGSLATGPPCKIGNLEPPLYNTSSNASLDTIMVPHHNTLTKQILARLTDYSCNMFWTSASHSPSAYPNYSAILGRSLYSLN